MQNTFNQCLERLLLQDEVVAVGELGWIWSDRPLPLSSPLYSSVLARDFVYLFHLLKVNEQQMFRLDHNSTVLFEIAIDLSFKQSTLDKN